MYNNHFKRYEKNNVVYVIKLLIFTSFMIIHFSPLNVYLQIFFNELEMDKRI